MSVWRLILGLVFLTLGAVCIVFRDRIKARHVRIRGHLAQPPMVWTVLGSIYALVGVVWLISAFIH